MRSGVLAFVITNLMSSRSNRIFISKSKGSTSSSSSSLSRLSESSYRSLYDFIIGVDEAGRGPLAGPVVCAAIIVPPGLEFDNIFDSKTVSEMDREKAYERLTTCKDATMLGMQRATLSLLQQNSSIIDPARTVCLVDGNRVPNDMPVESKYVIKGDSTIFSIAAASIIAKVTRDRIMLELDKKYPVYNLAQHKGYPTFEHRTLLHEHGPSEIHRMSYAPVRLAAIHHGLIPIEVNEGGTKEGGGREKSKGSKGDKIAKVVGTESMKRSEVAMVHANESTAPSLRKRRRSITTSPDLGGTSTEVKKKDVKEIKRRGAVSRKSQTAATVVEDASGDPSLAVAAKPRRSTRLKKD